MNKQKELKKKTATTDCTRNGKSHEQKLLTLQKKLQS